MNQSRRWVGDLISLAIILGLLGAVSLLPPDTSLAQIRKSGVLRACVPPKYPPLVTGDKDRPGVDVELLHMIAARLGVDLSLNVNSNMGRDFDPRDWGLTRAQCEILAGGVVASTTTRSFLETTPPYLETGWALITPTRVTSLDGQTVGVHAGLSGLDRLGLSRFLKDQGAKIAVAQSAADLIRGLASGSLQAGVTEALNARQIAGEQGWDVEWLSEKLDRYPIAFGLWKGDLTLKRAVTAALNDLKAEGRFQAIADRYRIAPIKSTFSAQ